MVTDERQSGNGRSEHDIVTRAGIQIELGGERFAVRPRTIEKDEEWIEFVRSRLLGSLGDVGLDAGGLASLLTVARSSGATLIELLRAYGEVDGSPNPLPGPDWIRAHATSQEVQDGFVTLLEHAFPPFGMSRRLIPTDAWPTVVAMVIEMARDYLPAMARLGRVMREQAEAAEQLAAEPEARGSAKPRSPRSPSRNGASARPRNSGRR
jgi:hypothetical protein